MKILQLNIIIILFLSVKAFGQLDDAQNRYFKSLYYYEHQQKDSALIELCHCESEQACEMLKAKIHYENDNFATAINIYKKLLDKNPAESTFQLSLIYAQMGFADESVGWLQKYFEHKDPRYYSQIISNKEYDNISKTSEWREFWNENKYSKNYDRFEEVEYLIKQSKYDEAINMLNSLDVPLHNYKKNYLSALAYFHTKDIKSADKYIDLSINSKPRSVAALELKVKIAKENNDLTTCYNINSNLLKVDKFNPEHILNHAKICYLLSKYEEAEKYIKIYTKFFTDDENAAFLKAKILTKTESLSEALIILNELIGRNPSKTDYFALRADIYYDFKSWNFAANDYSMILDIDPFSSETHHKLGMCYFKQNQMEKACYYWHKATNLKNLEAKQMLYKYCNY
jgi:tetratricopeptide (TPR) repeat protein